MIEPSGGCLQKRSVLMIRRKNEKAREIKEREPSVKRLEFKNITKLYSKEVVALSDVTVSFNSGEIVALTGPSGAGKTSFAKIASGLIDADSGIVSDGSGRELSSRELRQIASCVMQRPEKQLFCGSVKEELEFSLRWQGADSAASGETIERISEKLGIEIEEKGPMSPFSLSHGERRMVSTASVLVSERPFVFMDEPTEGLDAVSRGRVTDMIKNLAGDGISVCVIAHDNSLILDVADRVIAMKDGRLKADQSIVDYAVSISEDYGETAFRANILSRFKDKGTFHILRQLTVEQLIGLAEASKNEGVL